MAYISIVLKTIEAQRAKGIKASESKLDKVLNTNLPLRGATSTDPSRAEMDEMKDILSHFILRMAFCQSEELRRWFLNHESQLFRYRIDKLSKEAKLSFMKRNGMDFHLATAEEVAERRMKLKICRDAFAFDVQERSRNLGMYLKVPFQQALDLVSTRRGYIERGIVFVPIDNLVSILVARFRSNLSRQLAIAYKHLPRAALSRDERLMPVLKNLAKQYVGPSFSFVAAPTAAITATMIDDLAKSSMPLCMRTLHNAFRTNHHLKHAGRMSYGLFLKGIGLPLEEALTFWRTEMTNKMTVDQFNKRYAYNIRHNYGKEGKRQDYTPYTCGKIIMGEAPKTGEYHGCPFRHYDEFHLRSALQGIDDVARDAIMQLVSTKQYQLGCKRYFEATHKGGDSDAVGNHPNTYFDSSRAFYATKQPQE